MKFLLSLVRQLKPQRRRASQAVGRRGRIITPFSLALALALPVGFPTVSVRGVDGVWTNSGSNSTWGTASNWSGNTIASGVDAVADFTLDITANRTVNLGANFTVGKIIAEDETTVSNNWIIANGAGGPWALTLATTVGVPTIQVNTSSTLNITAVLAGTQGLQKTGSGTLVLNGINTFTGGITLAEGTLNFATGTLNNNTITFTADAALGWAGTNTQDLSSFIKIEDGVMATINTAANNVTFATALQTGVAATGGLLKNGGGTLTLTAVNTYTGLTRVRQGRLVLAGGDNRLATTGTIAIGQNAQSGILQLGDASGAVNQTTTSLVANGTGTANAVVGGNALVSTLTLNPASGASVTYAGLLGGAGTNENNLSLIKTGAGTFIVNNAANTFTGGVTLNQGVLSFAAGALGTTGNITFAAASTLQWATGNTSDISARVVLSDGVVGTIDTNGGVITLANPFQTGVLGTGSLTKGGAGTLILKAINTYTGNTRINNGRVILTGGDNRLSTQTLLQFGNAANSGVLQLGDETGASNQTVRGLTVTGNVNSLSNAIVGGNAAISTLTVNNTTNYTWAQALGGTGTNENNLALVKSGTGMLTLSSTTSSFVGNITVTGGTLALTTTNGLGSGTKNITIVGTDTPSLRLENSAGLALSSSFTLITSNDDVTNAAVVNAAGDNVIGGGIRLTTGGAGTGNTRLLVSSGSLVVNGSVTPLAGDAANLTLFLDGTSNGTLNGVISDNGSRTLGVTKDGVGTWTLTAANSFTGALTVNAGRLNITTAQTGGGAISLADNSVLAVTLSGAGQSLSSSSLTLGSSTGATLDFALGTLSNPTQAILTTNVLSTAGTTTLNISGTGLSVGQFGLIDYSGSIGGAGFAGLTLGSLPARVTGSLVNNVGATRVDLNITAFDVPKWTGAVSGDWDVNDSADPTVGSGSVNWKETTSGNATRYLQYLGVVDTVRFDDSATGTTIVNLTTQLTPNSVTVSNNTLNYTFSGFGYLSGSTNLLKEGSGSLTLANNGFNDYTGTTTINGGSLIVGDGTTPGAGQLGTGAISLGAAGSLVINRPDDLFIANVISGSGTLIKQVANILLLQGNNATYDGVIHVQAGTLIMGSTNALGSTVGNTVVHAGANLDISGFNAVAEAVTLDGGRLKVTTGATNKIDSPVTLANGGGFLTEGTSTLTVAGLLSGSGGLVKEGTGTVILTQAAAYTGGTVLRGGVLQLGASAGTSTVAMLSAGSIDFAAVVGESATLSILRADSTLNIASTITSSGAGSGNIIIGVGGAASVSGIVTFSGVNTYTGNISIVGGGLRITNSSALGAGAKTVTIGNASRPGLLINGSAGNITLSSDIHYNISSDGAGTATNSALGAIVSEAGDNVIQGGISVINGGGGNGKIYVQSGSLVLNGTIDPNGASGNRTIIFGGLGVGTANGVISEYNLSNVSVMNVTKSDAGTWTLTAANTFTGAVAIQEGVLKISNILANGVAQPLGTGTSALSLGTTTSATLEYTGAADATLGRDITLGGTGGGIIRNSGGGVLTLAGILTRAASRPLTFTGGTFIISGQITGAAAVNQIDGATVTFSQTTNNFLGSTQVYGGGVFKNGASDVLTDTSTVVLGEAANNTNGTYDLNGYNETIAGLSSAGTGSKTVTNSAANGTATLTLNNTGSSSYDGIIRDGATAQTAVVKSGTGIQTLSGANTYTGKTTVSGGTLALSGAAANIQSSSWVQVDSGATLDVSSTVGTYTQGGETGVRAISGAGTVNGSIILNGKVTLSAGASSDAQNIATAGDGIGSLTFNNDLTLGSGASTLNPRAIFQLAGATANTDPTVVENILAFANTASANVDHVTVLGALTLNAGSVLSVTLANYTPVYGDVFNLLDWGTVNLNSFDAANDLHLPTLSDPNLAWAFDQFSTAGLLYITTVVPEPSRALLSLAGVAALLLRRRRTVA